MGIPQHDHSPTAVTQYTLNLGEAVRSVNMEYLQRENARLVTRNAELEDMNKRLTEKLREYNRLSRKKK